MKADVTPGRCGYCGCPCDGAACAAHRDLLALEISPDVHNGDNAVEGGEK